MNKDKIRDEIVCKMMEITVLNNQCFENDKKIRQLQQEIAVLMDKLKTEGDEDGTTCEA